MNRSPPAERTGGVRLRGDHLRTQYDTATSLDGFIPAV
jgi:hypothetical protein